MRAVWVSRTRDLAEVTEFFASHLDSGARPDLVNLRHKVHRKSALVRAFQLDALDGFVAAYVLYGLSTSGVDHLLSGAAQTARGLREEDFCDSEVAGYYISSLAAIKGAAREMLTDLTEELRLRGPAPVFARAATDAGRHLLVRSGFRPLPDPSEVWLLHELGGDQA